MSNTTIECSLTDPREGFTLGIQVAYGECPTRGQFHSVHFGFLLFDFVIYRWI